MVAERQRHLTVYEDQVGSTPIHFAKEFLSSSSSRARITDSQSVDASSNLAGDTNVAG